VRELARAAPESEETVELGQTARIWIQLFGWRLGISKEEADAVLAEGRAVAERSGNPASLAMLLTAFGPGLAATGQVERYVELSLQARRLADESGVLEARLFARSNLAFALHCSGGPAEGVAVADEGIELFGGDPTIGFPGIGSGLAFFIAFRGLHLASLGRLGEAASDLDRAIRIARQQQDIERLCWALTWQVWGPARYAGDAQAALDYARESVEIAEAIGSPHSLVWSCATLGCAHVLSGEWSEAVAACERSRAIAHERGAALEFMPRVLGPLAEAYLGSGDETRARRTAEEAVEYARGAGLRLFGLTSELALGRVLLRAGNSREHDEAETVLRDALALAREIGARSEEPLFRVELAELARLRGDEAARLRELHQANKLFSEIGATARAEQVARQLEAVEPAHGG
jgi:tetratricopeptide (TPR) repeat protein